MLAVVAILCVTVVALSSHRPESIVRTSSVEPAAPELVAPSPTPLVSSGDIPAATPAVAPTPSPTPTIRVTGTVFIDPGHGGVDTGTVGYTSDGREVMEKTVTLAIALRTAALLRAAGATVVLSRTNDSLPGLTPADLNPDGQSLTAQGVLDDLQRRIDRANASGAALLLSIHLNSFSDPSIGGVETYYDTARRFSGQNLRLANLVQQDLVAALHGAGYTTPDRGIINDADLQTESLGALPTTYNHLALLGPAVPGQLQPSEIPGVLSEPLFLSDPAEAAAALDPAMQSLIAGAYAHAIEQYLSASQP